MRAREGDFVETLDGSFFDVKGLVHPPGRVVAFIRYFPDKDGQRKKNGVSYGKVYSLSERYKLLAERHPGYLVYDPVFDETLCEVADRDVRVRYDPVDRLARIGSKGASGSLEEKVVQFAEDLRGRTRIGSSAVGVSGSLLVGLDKPSSDLDLIVYGSKNCKEAYSALQEMLKDRDSSFRPYNVDELRRLFDFRSKDSYASFQQFLRTESKKAFQGKFMDTDYFVRFVKDWDEVQEEYGQIEYRNLGRARVKAKVADDSESIFTPCTYVLEQAVVVDGPRVDSITEVVSFRGRFCDQARKGGSIAAQGKIEKVTDHKRGTEHLRLLVGNERSDYMFPA